MCSLISHAFPCKLLWCRVWTKAILWKCRGLALILQHLPLCLGRACLAYTFLGLPGCTALVTSEGWSRGLSQSAHPAVIADIWYHCPGSRERWGPGLLVLCRNEAGRDLICHWWRYQYPEQQGGLQQWFTADRLSGTRNGLIRKRIFLKKTARKYKA